MSAESSPANPERRPRIWPALVVLFGVTPAAVVLQLPVLVLILIAQAASSEGEAGEALDALLDFPATSGGFLLLLVLAQTVYAVASFVPAALSQVPLRERLGLVRGRLAPAAYPVVMVGSILVIYLGEILWVLVFDEPSANLLAIHRAFSEAPLLLGLVMVAAASLLPGLLEETTCRGYVQRRLLQRWPPVLAIGLTSTIFAAMHIDPQHVLSVLPIAFWLGYVAWRSASIWPGIACHAFINALGLSIMAFGGHDPLESTEPVTGGWWLAATLPAFVAAVVLLERAGRVGGDSGR